MVLSGSEPATPSLHRGSGFTEKPAVLPEKSCSTVATVFRDYVAFALENEESLDALYIGYRQARAHLLAGKITFRNLSPEAKKMLDSRKLWDFMEDIPDNDDPRAVCRTILEELLRKAE